MIVRAGQSAPSALALAAVAGGAVTRERLANGAALEAGDGSPLVRSLISQGIPAEADLARAYSAGRAPLRLDGSFVHPAPHACNLLDPALLRRLRCIPVEIYADLCVLAVDAPGAIEATSEVRAALHRSVLPVLADSRAIDRALAELPPAATGRLQSAEDRPHSPVAARFRALVLEGKVVDALAATEAGR